jgi:hypothetical protein
MIRTLSREFPDQIIVVRPHPVELEDAWRKMIGDFSNVMVLREGSVSPWLRNCSLMINNGCTTALEAAASDVPRIAYKPFSMYYEESIPNRVCHPATSLNQLIEMVKLILKNQTLEDIDAVQLSTYEILDNRFSNLKGELAADRIVQEWETIDPGLTAKQSSVDELINLKKNHKKTSVKTSVKRFLAQKKNQILGVQPSSSKTEERLLYNPHKFPSLTEEEIEKLLFNLKNSLSRFHKVKYQKFGDKSYIFYT